ncbi:MAG: TusE/DsrC/DsvC family sulfur relay protein [Acidobacteria bacterium]|nr:TusE/DsrC/DsvC family sulfur relay protein [Acidobacteriota bacterium]MCB9396600.1 TusE/DsrC/DsvC family sulfur relay protein [Acidobacteriota bacterium]
MTYAMELNKVGMDNEGFLLNPQDWTMELGQELAAQLGIDLSPTHWRLINFAREDYANQGQSPGLRRMAQQSGVTMKEIYQLFPKGPGKLVAKIAGIPKPKSCI